MIQNIWAVGLLTIKLLQGSPFYYAMGNNQRLINDCKFSFEPYTSLLYQ